MPKWPCCCRAHTCLKVENTCFSLQLRNRFHSSAAFISRTRGFQDSLSFSANLLPEKSGLLVRKPSRRREGINKVPCRCSTDEVGDAAVAAAIYEVEVMVREPQEVLHHMRERLSTQDLQLILLYFSQEGRDAWYALEVFEWMQGEGRAGDDTRNLMMSIMSKWLLHVVVTGGSLEDVKSLLQDMECVGLRPEPDILQALVCAYWDKGSREDAMALALDHANVDDQTTIVALMWKMIYSNDQRQALEFVGRLRESTKFKLSFHFYQVALLAVISEQQQVARTLKDLVVYQKKGLVGHLTDTDRLLIREYEMNLQNKGEKIAGWALEEHPVNAAAVVHQKLLTMYCLAGRGPEAMRALFRLKLTGKRVQAKLFNVVLGICAYSNHQQAISLVLNTMKEEGPAPDKQSYSALFGGYVNGGHADQAIRVFLEMLDQGFLPDKNSVLAAMRQLTKTRNISLVHELGQRLVQAELVEPFVIYVIIDSINLSIILSL